MPALLKSRSSRPNAALTSVEDGGDSTRDRRTSAGTTSVLAPGLRRFAADRFERLAPAAGKRDREAGARQGKRGGPADAAPGAGDQCEFVRPCASSLRVKSAVRCLAVHRANCKDRPRRRTAPTHRRPVSGARDPPNDVVTIAAQAQTAVITLPSLSPSSRAGVVVTLIAKSADAARPAHGARDALHARAALLIVDRIALRPDPIELGEKLRRLRMVFGPRAVSCSSGIDVLHLGVGQGRRAGPLPSAVEWARSRLPSSAASRMPLGMRRRACDVDDLCLLERADMHGLADRGRQRVDHRLDPRGRVVSVGDQDRHAERGGADARRGRRVMPSPGIRSTQPSSARISQSR